LVAITIFLAVVVLVQVLTTMIVGSSSALTEVERLKAMNDARGSLAPLLAGVGVSFALIYTAATYALERQREKTDRFTKAIEQLGHDSETVRAGGVFGLWLLSRQDPTFWRFTEEILCALIRERSKKGCNGATTPIAADIQAAATVVGNRPQVKPGKGGPPLDLRNVNLNGVRWARANLEYVLLSDSDLVEADLEDAHLRRAKLQRATLTEAKLGKAKLRQADLTDAKVDGADFYLTDVAQAQIGGCDLNLAMNLTTEQLASTDFKPRPTPS
jgi:hypothetical protein